MFDLVIMASALLLAGTPAAPAFEPAVPPEKMLCRRYAEIGSLVKKKRVCHTMADWKRIDQASQSNLDYMRNARNGTRLESQPIEGVGVPLGNCPPQC